MQIFEYYFNPKVRRDRFFEIFSFEPEKDSSKGNLYLVGELANALPQNSGFLQKLAKIISQEYSAHAAPKSHEVFFRSLLKKANEFLAQELRRENVDWLLNLHTALLYIKNSGKKSFFAIAKSGTMRAFMARGTNVVDLGKNIEDPARGNEIFGSIVSGFALPQDKLLILTSDICGALQKDQGLSDLSVLSQEKQFQAFFRQNNKILSRLSGILLALLVEESIPQAPKLSFLRKNILSFRFPKFQFAFSQFLRLPIFKAQTKKNLPSVNPWAFFHTMRGRIAAMFGKDKWPSLPPAFKEKIVLVGTLVVLALVGFLLFQGERKELAKQVQTVMLQIQVIQKEAQDALELSDQRSANILLQEAWKKASSRAGSKEPSREIFVALQEELEQQLLSINSIEYVEDPVVLLDMGQEGVNLIPQEMVLEQGSLYLFNPFSSDIFTFDVKEKKGEIVQAPATIRYGIPFAGSPLFFGEPDFLFSMTPEGIDEFKLRDTSSFAGMAGFGSSLYFLNSHNGTIMKYENPLSNSAAPAPWIVEESLKKPAGARSMTIDGNVWILTHDNTLQRYFGGSWQEDIKPLIFPLLKNATVLKTFPGLPYLYLLDSSESRVIVLAKSGNLVKQYLVRSQKPLSDFTVSSNGNTLYLLSGSRVFQIQQ